jgi:hypothetical protein
MSPILRSASGAMRVFGQEADVSNTPRAWPPWFANQEQEQWRCKHSASISTRHASVNFRSWMQSTYRVLADAPRNRRSTGSGIPPELTPFLAAINSPTPVMSDERGEGLFDGVTFLLVGDDGPARGPCDATIARRDGRVSCRAGMLCAAISRKHRRRSPRSEQAALRSRIG